MQRALQRHDTLLARALERHGGYVFKTIGDAFCATFADAQAAVAAALDIQLLLAAEDWSEVDGLRVRIAIHAGVADERGGDYFGPSVNRVARLLATAHGGQVILSNVAAQLVGADGLPPGAALRDLGSHVLRDLREPERVYQLNAPGLQSEFRRLRSVAARCDNLPAQLTSFVGREAELHRLSELLRDGRIVTVLGTGGVGKTRLALRAGELFVNSGGEACFVNLAPLGDATLVVASILAALGAGDGNAAPLDALLQLIRKRRILILLDNCERVVDEVARIARLIAERCSEAVVLCTSREPLNVAGERALRLSPFDRATAVALFVERAVAANPRLTLDEENRTTIEAICDRLDSIALALELAAARLRVISLEELSTRLDARLRILTGGSRSSLPHHQTMRALIDWSYELLSSGERTLFRRLAIFKRRFTFEAAAAICADDSADELGVLDLLSALVDKSLVVADVEDTGQFRFLELIEEYARERLTESDETGTLAASHARHYCAIAERTYAAWDLAPPADWLATSAPDIDNFRSALKWTLEGGGGAALGARLAASTMPVFLRLSLLNEGVAWCEAALAADPGGDDETRARLFYGASMLYNNQVAFKNALAAASEALALYERGGDDRGVVRSLSQLARQYERAGRRGEARAHAERAVALARGLHDKRLLAASLQRGAAVFEPADIELARAWFAESVELYRDLGRDDETARAFEWWSAAEADAGYVDRALAIALEGLPLAGRDARVYATNSIAAFAIVLGDGRAAEMSQEAFVLAADVRHPVLLPLAFTYLAAVRATQDPALAARFFGYAQARLAATEWKLDEIDAAVEVKVREALRAALGDSEIETFLAEGAAWDDARAIIRGHRG